MEVIGEIEYNELMRDNNYIDKQLSLIISLQVFLLGSKNCLIQGIPSLFYINDRLNLVIMAIVGILYIYAFLISLSRHVSRRCLLFWLFILLSYMFTVLFFPENLPYIKDTFLRVVTILFLTSILIAKLRDLSWLKKYMTLLAYPTIIAGVMGGLFISYFGHVTTSEYEGDSYAMSLSYAVLIAVMWLLHSFFKDASLKALVFAIVGVVVIILYGSRNPLLAIGTYIFVELFDKAEYAKKTSTRIFYKVVLSIGGVMAVFYKSILRALLALSSELGFNSRTLNMLTDDTVDMTNRDTIHKQLWDLINENPLTGLGIQGDMAQMDEMAHGLYLSIISTYGYVIGIAFLIYLFSNCLAALKRAKGLDHQILVLYICLVIPRGFSGGDMWQSDVFWWLMALLFVILSKKCNYDNKRLAI